MEAPMTRPTPSYPPNFVQPTENSSEGADSPFLKPRKSSSGLSLPGLGGKRSQSYLSLASLSLAHSSSSLLGIFSSALDSVPVTPIPTPPVEIRRERAVIEEIDKWALIRDIVRGVTLLFTLGYAFALFPPPTQKSLQQFIVIVGK